MSSPALQGQANPANASAPATRDGAGGTVARRASMLITGRGSATTPRRLRLSRLALTVLTVVLTAGGIATSAVLAERQSQADVQAAQYVRTSAIETELLRAHAATASSLVQAAGAQASAQQTIATNATDTAASTLLEIASAGTDDPAALAAVSQGILRYTQTLAQAQQQRGTEAFRATLDGAYGQLTEDLLPKVDALQNAHRAESTMGVVWWMWLLPVFAWLTAAAILAASWYVARTSHRVVNAGLALALAATVTVALYSGNVITSAQSGGLGDSFSRLESLATARQATIGGHALLANGVATRTWSKDDTTALQSRFDEARQALDGDSDLQPQVDSLRTGADAVRAAAESRDWDAATSRLLDTGKGDQTGGFLDKAGEATSAALADVHAAAAARQDQITLFAVVAVLCSLGAGLAAIAGFHQRLKDYR